MVGRLRDLAAIVENLLESSVGTPLGTSFEFSLDAS